MFIFAKRKQCQQVINYQNKDDKTTNFLICHAKPQVNRILYKDMFDFSNKMERDNLIDRLVKKVLGGVNVTK